MCVGENSDFLCSAIYCLLLKMLRPALSNKKKQLLELKIDFIQENGELAAMCFFTFFLFNFLPRSGTRRKSGIFGIIFLNFAVEAQLLFFCLSLIFESLQAQLRYCMYLLCLDFASKIF